jgi:hypothetical protein
VCVDEEKRKKKRRREGLGERKKKWRWPWRERKKKQCWPAALWVSPAWVSPATIFFFFFWIFLVLIGCSCSVLIFCIFVKWMTCHMIIGCCKWATLQKLRTVGALIQITPEHYSAGVIFNIKYY